MWVWPPVVSFQTCAWHLTRNKTTSEQGQNKGIPFCFSLKITYPLPLLNDVTCVTGVWFVTSRPLAWCRAFASDFAFSDARGSFSGTAATQLSTNAAAKEAQWLAGAKYGRAALLDGTSARTSWAWDGSQRGTKSWGAAAGFAVGDAAVLGWCANFDFGRNTADCSAGAVKSLPEDWQFAGDRVAARERLRGAACWWSYWTSTAALIWYIFSCASVRARSTTWLTRWGVDLRNIGGLNIDHRY